MLNNVVVKIHAGLASRQQHVAHHSYKVKKNIIVRRCRCLAGCCLHSPGLKSYTHRFALNHRLIFWFVCWVAAFLLTFTFAVVDTS